MESLAYIIQTHLDMQRTFRNTHSSTQTNKFKNNNSTNCNELKQKGEKAVISLIRTQQVNNRGRARKKFEQIEAKKNPNDSN